MLMVCNSIKKGIIIGSLVMFILLWSELNSELLFVNKGFPHPTSIKM